MTGTTPPAEFDALVALFRAGRIAAARKSAAELRETYPADSRLWNLSAAIEDAGGDTDRALEAYAKALELDPGNVRAFNNRAILLQKLARFDEAAADLAAGLRLRPGDPDLLNTLSTVKILQGKHAEAEASLRAALSARPDFVEALINLGVVLTTLGMEDDAVAMLRRALALRPDAHKARAHLGQALVKAGRHAQAINELEQVSAVSPAQAVAQRQLAVAHEQLGQKDAAVRHAEAAVASAPDTVAPYLVLSRLRPLAPDGPHLSSMGALAKNPQTPPRERADVLFAIGRALDAHPGRENEAFAAFEEANQILRGTTDYDPAADLGELRQIMSRPVTIGQAEPGSPTPIFIVGMPRSGTTLAEQILASHSAVHGAGELSALTRAVTESGWRQGPSQSVRPEKLAASYRNHLPAFPQTARFVTDKMPLNFRWIGFVAEAFPEAPIIHLVRHPMAVCWSIYSRVFAEGAVRFGYDMAELAAYYHGYRDVMAHWDRVLPGRVYHLDYRALTEDQEAETRRLLDHAGLPFEAACLNFHQTQRAVATASALQVRQRMYSGSSDVWRRYAAHLQPMADALGDVLDGWEK